MKKQEGLLIIEQKVDDFNKNESIYLSKTFQETEARNRFIDPFFTALGWELEQTKLKRRHWDVHREYSQKDNSSTKKPDYAFRVNESVKFFVEAKAPWVPLTEKAPVFQAKRYAFSTAGKTPIVILTDFQEFRVFNALERPIFDNPLQGLLKEFDLNYTQYIDKWDLIWDNFSKEAVTGGSLDRLAGKISKNTRTLDLEFLNDINEWRTLLAHNITLRNRDKIHSEDDINEAVQRVLDRLVFIRNLEDREIEPENQLFDIINRNEDNDAHYYKCLVPIFRRMNSQYNGLLFKPHFSEELEIDNKVIKEIIKSLCWPVSPFQFNNIAPEILGRIYEKFLGSKIRLTEQRAKVEEKMEVRKAGGVYYTPEYIVKYIVENTVGEIIKDKTPEEIAEIKIVDPACGSGSFLIGAFDYLVNYHVNWYSENKLPRKYKNDFYETPGGEIRVSIQKKREILKNNIFGVDIDREATEVAIMSLYLKLLEEGFDKGEALLFAGTLLPDMTGNIKCGNSLIGTDYFEGQLAIDKDEWKNVNPFDWEKEFEGIFKKGGFDCVIGNPPYVRSKLLDKNIRDILSNNFGSAIGTFDIYSIFIEKSFKLLNDNGLIAFINPNKYFYSDYGIGIRKFIANKHGIKRIIDFNEFQVFKGITTYTAINIFSKIKNNSTFIYSNITDKNIEMSKIEDFLFNGKIDGNINNIKIEMSNINDSHWIFKSKNETSFINRIKKDSIPLENLCYKIYQGFVLTPTEVFPVSIVKENSKYCEIQPIKQDESIYEIEKDLLIPIIKSSSIFKYYFERKNYYSVFPYKYKTNKDIELISEKILKSDYPKTYNYFLAKSEYLKSRENGRWSKSPNWYEYSRKQNFECQKMEKILVPGLATKARYTLAGTDVFIDQGSYGIILNTEFKVFEKYILGLLNSSLLDFIFKSSSGTLSGGYYSYQTKYLNELPIKLPASSEEKNKHDQILIFVNQSITLQKEILNLQTDQEKAMLTRQADMLDRQIDKLVYELYGLTEEEIKVVEGKE